MKGDVERFRLDAGFLGLDVIEDRDVAFAFVRGKPGIGGWGRLRVVGIDHVGRSYSKSGREKAKRNSGLANHVAVSELFIQ